MTRPEQHRRSVSVERFLPAWGWLRRYRREDLGGDLVAGAVVAVMLVPQGMAYALLAGMPPVAGLYAATLPVLAYALFGSSRQLAVGPVALASLLTLSAVERFAPPGGADFVALAALLALLVGAVQLALGLLRAGFITNFLSHAVISGFTSAAALIIAVSQLKHLLGVHTDGGDGLVALVRGLLPHLRETSLPTVLLGAGSVAVLLALKRLRVRSLPGPLVVVVLGTLLVALTRLDLAGVAIVGPVPRGVPLPALPALDAGAATALLPAALTIAFVGFMESFAVAKSIAAREGYSVDANRELVGLGLAGLAAGLVRAYPVAGGFGRSAVNYQSGARTPLASIVTVALMILTLLFLTPLFTYLPRAVLGAIVFVAVTGLIDLREPLRLLRLRPADGWSLLVTAAATLFIGVEIGILVGVGFSLLVFVARSAYPHVAEVGLLEAEGVFRNVRRYPEARRFDGVLVARPDASLYFANMAFLETWLERALERRPDVSAERGGAPAAGAPRRAVVLDCSAVNDMDAVALEALERRLIEWGATGIELHLCGVKGPVRDLLQRSGFARRHPDRVAHLSAAHALATLAPQPLPDAPPAEASPARARTTPRPPPAAPAASDGTSPKARRASRRGS